MSLEVALHPGHPFCKDCLKGYEGGPYSSRWESGLTTDGAEETRLVLAFPACPAGRADDLRSFLSMPRFEHDHTWASKESATRAAQETYAALDRWIEASHAAGRIACSLEVARQRARVSLAGTIHKLITEETP